MSRPHRLALVMAFVTAALGTPPVVAGQSEGPAWGVSAPELAMTLLDGPPGARATLAGLEGQAVVLDFWATWCSGCIVLIPHLNQLTEQFKDAPVRFISITDEEDQNVVRAFLKRRPIRGWVALDDRGETFRRYGIVGRPYAALIDARGVLRGVIPSAKVDAATVEALLSGTLELTRPPESSTPLIGTETKSPLPLLQAIVRPAMQVDDVGVSPGFTRLTGNRWETWGVDVRRLLSTAYGVPETRIVLPENQSTLRYDVSILLPDESVESRLSVLRQLVQSAFGITVRRETREMPVVVLSTSTDGPRFEPLENGKTIRRVVGFAEMTLKTIVLDETGLPGTYDYVLTFPRNEQELRQGVTSLGLMLTPARRSVELLVVEPAGR